MFTDRWWMQKLPNGWIHMIHDTLDGQGTVSSLENCGIFEVNKSNIRARKTTNVWWQSEVVVQSHRENKTENAISDSYFSPLPSFHIFQYLLLFRDAAFPSFGLLLYGTQGDLLGLLDLLGGFGLLDLLRRGELLDLSLCPPLFSLFSEPNSPPSRSLSWRNSCFLECFDPDCMLFLRFPFNFGGPFLRLKITVHLHSHKVKYLVFWNALKASFLSLRYK